MLKILYDHQCYSYQDYGGVSRYYTELIRHLKQNNLAQPKVAIKYSNNQYLNSLKEVVSKPFLNNYQFKGKKLLLDVLNRRISTKIISMGNFDIFHPTYFNPYFLNYLKNKPFVITVHDMTHELFPDKMNKCDKSSEYKKLLVKKAKKIICVSNNTKNDLIKLYHVEEEKIKVIYHGNSLNYNRNLQFESSLKLPEKYILYVGSRKYYKNFILLIKALTDLIREGKDLKVICAGGGIFSKNEIKLFTELKILDRIIQLNVDDKILGALYSNALCFVFPSLYEGFGMPILEAFSCGCPVVCSNTSSLPEIAGDAAEYFDPNNFQSIRNAVEIVLTDKYKREKMISLGFHRLKNFNWENSAIQTFELYKECLNN
ncbi:MAG: glycosyltransferase family 4 protein [Bacteroidales bacterium]